MISAADRARAGAHADVFAGLPDAAANLGGVGFADAAVASEWAQLLHDLRDERITLPGRTTNTTLRPWLARVTGEPKHKAQDAGQSYLDRESEWARGGVAEELIRAGFAVADLALYGSVNATWGSVPVVLDDGPEDVEWSLMQDLGRACEAAEMVGDLGVRDALGWLMVFEQSPQTNPLDALIAPWAAVGLGGPGWLYAAAGFTPDEALAGIDAGTLDDQGARMMVALRGVFLPVA